jgi:nucleoside-diphosphate-sugar epimerase
MATVLVTGGTGLVGKHLCKHLKNAGYDVAILSQVRYNKSEFPVYYWNWKDEIAISSFIWPELILRVNVGLLNVKN